MSTISATASTRLDPMSRLLLTLAELAALTGLSQRHLRRLDASRSIPGRVTSGKRILFRTDAVRDWIASGNMS